MRKTAKFDETATAKRRAPTTSRVTRVTLRLDGGWQLDEASGPAFGQSDARSCARSIAAAVRRTGRTTSSAGGASGACGDRPWAVRGEVPLEDERSACGCTAVIFAGVRHQMPGKVFGSNWLELRHEPSGTVLCFDTAGALLRWSELSLELLDTRRSGLPAWSGWTCDAAEMRAAWEASTYATSTTYRRREEWDWCYRSDYCGAPPSRGAGARGACARRAAELLSHQLISTGPKLQSMGGGGVGGGGGIRGVTRSGGGKGLDSRDSWLTAATGAEPAAPTAAPTAPAS